MWQRKGKLIERLQEQLDFTSVQSPSDPLYPYQWYLKNTGQSNGKPRLDLNVEAAWAMGITGKNITTAIMDDGVDYMHPDLKNNFNAEASYDFSSNDPYPYPRYTDDWFNSHGTRCAGEISAARDNGVCGVGVAYDSKVAGIRMLDQPYMTDLIEANSMGHEPNLIHIYSASWGPTDDGKTVDGPRNATMRAIVKGVNEGRNGLGSIFVWASGDGGEDDDCNCDGYAASMWTISINSAINNGENAHYDESCSSTLASTFSNGGRNPETGVATTDLYGRCTRSHSGTSAAAPEAAGVFALALEANPNITWRDLQHLTVLTSSRNSLFDGRCRDLPLIDIDDNHRNNKAPEISNCTHYEWQMNGVGLEYNHLFGFGVLDAAEMVTLAMVWKTAPPRYHCEAGTIAVPHEIPETGVLMLEISTDACVGSGTEINYLEHVQAIVTLNSTRRGDTTMYLISPMGTRLSLSYSNFGSPKIFASSYFYFLCLYLLLQFLFTITQTHTHTAAISSFYYFLCLSILYNFILDFFTIPVTVFIIFIFIISSLSFFGVKFLMYLFSSFFLKSATKTSLSKKNPKSRKRRRTFFPIFFKCNFSIFFIVKKL
uniref:P/Homo B domain-containing protein n=1 Tax=Panagrolaimus sp. PS1159 TaxID=55785 RepID=A0AC35FQX5_9BILA